MSALGVGDISSSSVSRITKELDENVEEFLSKPIEHEIPCPLHKHLMEFSVISENCRNFNGSCHSFLLFRSPP